MHLQAHPAPETLGARTRMVLRQLAGRGVRDQRVLAAMRWVPREWFLPPHLAGDAYTDAPLPIGSGQTISQPYVVALMTQLLELRGEERVLEVGTGSGYQASILGELAKDVYSMEIVPELAAQAAQRLAGLGYTNVQTRLGDGHQGWPEAAPFDAVIVTCSPDHVPAPLFDQLKEGGRLVIPVGTAPREQMLHQLQKVHGQVVQHPVIPVSFVPMTGQEP